MRVTLAGRRHRQPIWPVNWPRQAFKRLATGLPSALKGTWRSCEARIVGEGLRPSPNGGTKSAGRGKKRLTHLRGIAQSGRVALAAVAACLAALVAAAPIQAQDEPPPPDPRFGAVETYHTPAAADASRVGWTRIIFYWSELKKDGPDEWNWFHAPLHRIDREIEGGREIVGLLKDTPAFATDGIRGAGVPRGLYLPVDDPGNLWAGFVREVVSAYEGRVHRWIIWNEPDIPLDTFGAQWAGSTEDYYQLVKVAYLAAREVDPAAQIHLGGLTYWHNPNYLREFLTVASQDPTAAEHGYYFDVVSVHVYFKPETTPEIVGAVRGTLAEFGLDKPIWINETNAPPYDDPAQPWAAPDFRVTQDMQAAFLLQEFALALASGVERVSVYKWIDEPPLRPGFEPYGLLRTERTARPAYHAFRAITTHYAGTVGALHLEQPALQQVILARGEQTTRVLWARTSQGLTVAVPALAGEGVLVDQMGKETPVRAQAGRYVLALEGAPCEADAECLMGGPPLLLVEQAPADLTDWPGMAATVSAESGAPPPSPAQGSAANLAPFAAFGLLHPLAVLAAGVVIACGAALAVTRSPGRALRSLRRRPR